jgi:uncharacterized membrane protein YcaP (DUF421 family)
MIKNPGRQIGMGTSVIRLLCLTALVTFGFRKMLSMKISEQSGIDLLLVISAAELAVSSVIHPEKPLMPILVPLLILILVYQSRLWFYRFAANWSIHEHLIHYLKKKPDDPINTNYEPPRVGLSLIENGKVRCDNLEQIGKTQLWLRQELRKFGYRNIRQVNYLTMDTLGNFYMDLNEFIRKN